MARRKQNARATLIDETSPLGIVVEKVEAVTKPCLKIIKSVVENEKIGFVSTPATDNRHKLTLVGQDVSTAFAREQYLAHSFLETQSKSYWLAVTIFFQTQPTTKKYLLESISLLIFEGIRSDEMKTALLRAEWDCYGDDVTAHAQPHWHVYLAALNNAPTEPAGFAQAMNVREFSATDETTPPNNNDSWEANKFHFAMASKWHIDEKCSLQEQFNDVSSIAKWIAGCLNYTKEQLIYISS